MLVNLKKIKDIRWKRILELIFEERPSNVLDVGCSSGYISSFLVACGVKVFGIDISSEKVEQAFKKGIIVLNGDASKGLPYKDNFFDVILAGEIIEHIIDTDYFLDEIWRVLKDNGSLVISTPNLANLENRLRVLVGRYPIFIDYTSRGDNHVRVYTGRALIRQLGERGFKIENYTGSFVPLFYSLFKKLNIYLMPLLGYLGRISPNFAIHTIVKARKL